MASHRERALQRHAVRTTDGLSPPLPPPAAGLGNDLTFVKLNPAAGVSYTPEGAPGFYAGFSQGNRPPSPVELGCADPDSPCHLPNAMASDPPLKQVVSRTLEAGARARTPRDCGGMRRCSARSTTTTSCS